MPQTSTRPRPRSAPSPGVPHHTDLRTKAGSRSYAETLVWRASALAPEDRELIRLVWGEGQSASAAARLMGVPARRIRARLRRLGDRLTSRRYQFVLRERASWPRRRRKVASLVVLEGRTLRDAGERLGLTLHQVRTEMAIVDSLCRASEGGA